MRSARKVLTSGLAGAERAVGTLAAVHHAGLVHRDVKAQNVMREEGGRLVLMDFGAGQKQSEPGTPSALNDGSRNVLRTS